jgi:hypothetical protein
MFVFVVTTNLHSHLEKVDFEIFTSFFGLCI